MTAALTHSLGQRQDKRICVVPFWIRQREERERENRGRKARHETLREMAERNQRTEEAYGAEEPLLAEQLQDVRLGRLGKLLRSVPLRGNGMQLGRGIQPAEPLE
jgi:hypothetical protein